MDGLGSGRLASKTLSEAVSDRLLRLIAQGALQPGDRLNEVHLAERFGVSRGPVREAARELEGKGVLQSRPRLGFYVATVTPREIVDVYEAKRWLEDALIADLSVHTSTAVRKAVLADIDGINETDHVAFRESLFQFRLRTCAHVRSRFLAELLVALYRRLYTIGAVVTVEESGERQAWILTTLRRFWRAMVHDDLDAARAVTAEDTSHWLDDLLPRFDEQADRKTPKGTAG